MPLVKYALMVSDFRSSLIILLFGCLFILGCAKCPCDCSKDTNLNDVSHTGALKCGDNVCQEGEDYSSCSQDCSSCDDGNPATIDSYDYAEHRCLATLAVDISSAYSGDKAGRESSLTPRKFLSEPLNCLDDVSRYDKKYCSLDFTRLEGNMAPALEIIFNIPNISKTNIKSTDLTLIVVCQTPIFIGFLSEFGDFTPINEPGAQFPSMYECESASFIQKTIRGNPQITDDNKIDIVVSSSNVAYSGMKIDYAGLNITYYTS
jgi:hypothetical protein